MAHHLLHSALSHLSAGIDRHHEAITEAIDAVVASHNAGGKEAFDARIATLREVIASSRASTEAMHQLALASHGLSPVTAVSGTTESPKPSKTERVGA